MIVMRNSAGSISKFANIAVLMILMGAQSALPLAAQNNQSNQETQTLTGCLRRGDAEAPYKLVAKDGIWNLAETKGLKISRGLDHTVTVKGTVVESFDTKAAAEGAKPKVRGILTVSAMKLVSTTCRQPD